MHRPQPRSLNFNLMLNSTEKKALEGLATHYGQSQGFVLRLALSNLTRMVLHRNPVCASGKPCPVPHIHVDLANPSTEPPAAIPASTPIEYPTA